VLIFSALDKPIQRRVERRGFDDDIVEPLWWIGTKNIEENQEF
jgi:hypothetical protein